MIDIHSHILPGLDDGAEDLADSLALAKQYATRGYTDLIATPHYVHGSHWAPKIAQVTEAIQTLQQSLEQERVPIRVHAGMEVSLGIEIPLLLLGQKILPLAASPYVLVELPFQRLPVGWDELLFQITAKGYRVILAHPERCANVTEEPGLLEDVLHGGVHVQANWASFAGLYGAEVAKAVGRMARAGYIHCLATDSHGAECGQLGRLRDAALRVRKLIGPQNLRLLAGENPNRLLRGEPLGVMPVIEAIAARKKRWWTRAKRA